MNLSHLAWLCSSIMLSLIFIAQKPANQIQTKTPKQPIRRLALIVGVGQYKAPQITDLRGPVNDARAMQKLLSGPNGFGFQPDNVRLLLDEQATYAAFLNAFRQHLIAGVKQPEDVVTIYFAGHGGQTIDLDGDESDGKDETLLFHDSRTAEVPDLIDDLFADLLRELYAKTQNIVVILDACNSGSAARNDSESILARRHSPLFKPSQTQTTQLRQRSRSKQNHGNFDSSDMQRIMRFSAAGDGTAALEIDGQGVFTSALISVLSQAHTTPLTYAQAMRRLRLRVRSQSYQTPYLEGTARDRVFFSNDQSKPPPSWEITQIHGDQVTLAGAPQPGVGVGAEWMIYGSPMAAMRGENAKAVACIQQTTSTEDLKLTATAKLTTIYNQMKAVKVGDLAVLTRPADKAIQLKVRLRSAPEPDGIAPARRDAIEKELTQDPEARVWMSVSAADADFEVAVDSQDRLTIHDRQGNIRNRIEASDREHIALRKNLCNHARQKALLQLTGEGGRHYRDHQTLQVSVKPYAQQPACASSRWQQSPANEVQAIPQCYQWYIEVAWPDTRLQRQHAGRLLVGGLVLSSDGSIHAFPQDRSEKLYAGGSYAFKDHGMAACPPLDSDDTVLVFGTEVDQPVNWASLQQSASQRSLDKQSGSDLYQTLDRYFRPGSRAAVSMKQKRQSHWTLSALTVRVVAHKGGEAKTHAGDVPCYCGGGL